MYPRIEEWDYVVFDTETTGLKWWTDKIFGISIIPPQGPGFYYDIRVDRNALKWLRASIPKCKLVVAHGAKFDWHMAREAGIHFPEGRVFCTVIGAALCNENELEYSLEHLAKKYTSVRKDTAIYGKLAAIFGGKPTAHAQAPNFQRAPIELIGPYAIDDGIATRELYLHERRGIEKDNLDSVLALELALLPAIVRMEQRGVRVDIEKAEEASAIIAKQIDVQQSALNKAAGMEINPNPSKSIHELFKPKKVKTGDGENDYRWELVDGTIAEKTDSGAASLDADCLRSMKHPCAGMILRVRKLIKTKNTFLDGHILNFHHKGVIHANYNQTKSDNDKGTGTGRFSVNDPALQQIHKRDEDIASVVRAVFIPPEGYDWVCNDWAQMDFRVFAHYVKNPVILGHYTKDPHTDFHQIVSDLTGIPRKPRYAGDANAKQINLGLVFGMGEGKLAAEMGLPYTVEVDRRGKAWLRPGEQAKAVFEKYHASVPGVKDMLENASSVARSRGYVRTIMGRHIRFPHGSTYKAGGLIFQGSAADALKVKIIQLDEYQQAQKGEAGYLAMNVHDEFDNMVPEKNERARMEISRIVTDFESEGQPIKFRVPIVSEQGVGKNWWEASK